MAAPVETVAAPPDLSLSDIRTLIAQQETLLGPLVSIGNDGSRTLLTFDVLTDPPETPAAIAVGDAPPNTTPLAEGKIFIAGQLQDVRAFRPH